MTQLKAPIVAIDNLQKPEDPAEAKRRFLANLETYVWKANEEKRFWETLGNVTKKMDPRLAALMFKVKDAVFEVQQYLLGRRETESDGTRRHSSSVAVSHPEPRSDRP